MDSRGNDTDGRCDRSIGAPKKRIALIDVDPTYHGLFEEIFEDEAIVVTFFGLGSEFIKIGSKEMSRFHFVVINHTLFDGRVIPFLEKCRKHFLGKVCVISTHGEATTREERKRLDITGDFEKMDRISLLGWFHYFSKEKALI